MLATIQIAEIKNGFIVIVPPQHHQNLIGAGMYPSSGKYYPNMDALVADAPTIIAVAVDAAREGEKLQSAAMQQRLQRQGPSEELCALQRRSADDILFD